MLITDTENIAACHHPAEWLLTANLLTLKGDAVQRPAPVWMRMYKDKLILSEANMRQILKERDAAAEIQPQVQRDLVVSAARRVQLAADRSDAPDQLPLDGIVDVFLWGKPLAPGEREQLTYYRCRIPAGTQLAELIWNPPAQVRLQAPGSGAAYYWGVAGGFSDHTDHIHVAFTGTATEAPPGK